jgi:hypothetical protein
MQKCSYGQGSIEHLSSRGEQGTHGPTVSHQRQTRRRLGRSWLAGARERKGERVRVVHKAALTLAQNIEQAGCVPACGSPRPRHGGTATAHRWRGSPTAGKQRRGRLRSWSMRSRRS